MEFEGVVTLIPKLFESHKLVLAKDKILIHPFH